MLLDAENGRPIEVEVILGEVVRMAKEKGVPVPVSLISNLLLSPLSKSVLIVCCDFLQAYRNDVCIVGCCPESDIEKIGSCEVVILIIVILTRT